MHLYRLGELNLVLLNRYFPLSVFLLTREFTVLISNLKKSPPLSYKCRSIVSIKSSGRELE